MTTTPRMDTEFTSWRIASTAAPSPPSLSPRPTQRPAAMAPASVTRTSSRARLRSGASRREPALMVANCPRAGLQLRSWDTRAMTTQPEPTAKPAKPRLLQDGRDMFWSIAPLVVACIVLAGLVGMCSFSPGGINRGPVPSYDGSSALRADARLTGRVAAAAPGLAGQLRRPRRYPRRPDRSVEPSAATRRHLHSGVHQPGR